MVENNSNQKCFFCGHRKANASWVGDSGEFFLCSPCATNIMPQFIGDAIFGGFPQYVKNKESNNSAVSYVKNKLDIIQSKYYEAIAKASLSESYSLSTEEIEVRGKKIMDEMRVK